MKPVRILSLLLTLSGVTLVSAQAPSESSHRHGRTERGPNPIVHALDADGDGEISLREIRDAVASLRLLDTNADGTLSFAELHPGRAADASAPATNSNRPHRLDAVTLALDADHDGALSPAEITAAKIRLLALDTNEDGKLTRNELHMLPASLTE